MPRTTSAPLVDFSDVAVLGDDVLMLDDASGAADAGEVLALRGPNGSGKTTLLRVLAGLQEPTTGRILVAGRVPDDRDRHFRRAVAALIGPPMTARDLTVAEHLQFVGATWGSGPRVAADAAGALLEELGIQDLARRYPHELSSGQAQLVAIGLTLARPAQVLLLDEPEQRLDPDRLGLVISALARRASAGTAIVLATHSPRLADELATDSVDLADEAPADEDPADEASRGEGPAVDAAGAEE